MPESKLKLARDICRGKRGQVAQACRTGQEDQLGALGLVLNAAARWTTRYPDTAVAERRREHQALDEDVARLSPLPHAQPAAAFVRAMAARKIAVRLSERSGRRFGVTLTLEFPVLLRLIEEQSTAFRAAVASAPHIGEGRRDWAATVAAGPAPAKFAAEGAPAAPREREALLAWLAESTEQLVDALRKAGPDRGCWTWWGMSQSPRTSGAVARHQLQQMAVHTYEAQITVGVPRPLPDEVALDGVEEFLSTCVATTSAWPHKPAAMDFHASEGRSWRLSLSAGGARTVRLPGPGTTPATAFFSARGTASALALILYNRIPIDSLELDGNRRLFEQLSA
ncbi:maleylpyruvate isomerase N-terminal domain-containing protein [Nonomuraea bangladeshensis]|uniref:maleylpyruvate isomerase N-terminal domain-containing protein n=1 Tax=Nonomuraea bangladeshensis TaxID=404385 RepID=UPI003C2D5992